MSTVSAASLGDHPSSSGTVALILELPDSLIVAANDEVSISDSSPPITKLVDQSTLNLLVRLMTDLTNNDEASNSIREFYPLTDCAFRSNDNHRYPLVPTQNSGSTSRAYVVPDYPMNSNDRECATWDAWWASHRPP
ncbi:hypothetical protein R1flu_017534 [Riccia fluitans]|uniref:Uncharacterized protein n=1 Tax=Riccia fluitans TaxID=41844 RepID=A0ABD1ZEJ6_9MARC